MKMLSQQRVIKLLEKKLVRPATLKDLIIQCVKESHVLLERLCVFLKS